MCSQDIQTKILTSKSPLISSCARKIKAYLLKTDTKLFRRTLRCIFLFPFVEKYEFS